MVILTSCLLGRGAYPGSRFRSQNIKDENALEKD